jgi:hypothetical protein
MSAQEFGSACIAVVLLLMAYTYLRVVVRGWRSEDREGRVVGVGAGLLYAIVAGSILLGLL